MCMAGTQRDQVTLEQVDGFIVAIHYGGERGILGYLVLDALQDSISGRNPSLPR